MTRAYVFTEYGGTDKQALVDIATPVPGRGELLVDVAAAGVNPVDWKFREGYLKDFVPKTLPAVFGGEAAGTVAAVGEGVEGFAVGDEVFGHSPTGGYAQQAILPAATTAHRPAAVSAVVAAGLPIAAGTAWDAIHQLDLPSGATLAVIGAGGGVGVIAVQLAVLRGVRVLAVASAAKAEGLHALGAEPVTSGDGVADRLRELVPTGVDAILDLVGGEALRGALPALREGGALVSGADYGVAALGGSSIKGSGGRTAKEAVAELVAEGRLDPLVTATYPLDRAAEALAQVEDGHVWGKVAITV